MTTARFPGSESRLLGGWGRSTHSRADVVVPSSSSQAADVLEHAVASKQRVLARGLGRSYGDAAQCAGGLVIDMTKCGALIAADSATGVIRAEAGLSLGDLMEWAVPRGWFVPVTPGTRHVTLGGALAADVHGKNHHRDGSFAAAVRSIRLATPTGTIEVSPTQHQDVFWATAGGMGLTGLVLDVELQLIPIETSTMLVETERTNDLDGCLSTMTDSDHLHHYSVAWIDCLATGRKLGRSVLLRGDHARRDQLSANGRKRTGPANAAGDLAFAPKELVSVPMTPPGSPLTARLLSVFNEAWYRKSPKHRTGEEQSISSFFHPLDGVGNWNRLYGRLGFTQYQFVVPFGAEDVLRHVLEGMAGGRVPSFLAVLKRFGAGDAGHLSFPAEGWTLALDIPVGRSPALAGLLDGFDQTVAECGGRVYFAKDGRLGPDLVGHMYPRLGEWAGVKRRLDPDGILVSDLSDRLRLEATGTGAP